jgi:hypothetical protein
VTQKADTLAALARIEAAQSTLHKKLKSVPAARRFARPPSGHWSPMENLRHLIFAEQHHVGRFLPKGFRWSSVGVPPPNRKGERRLSPVGSDAATPLDEVFEAWAKVHGVVRSLCLASSGDPTPLLEGNLRHVMVHAEAIDRLLAETAP